MLLICQCSPAQGCVAGKAVSSLSLEVCKLSCSMGNGKRLGQADLDLKAQWLGYNFTEPQFPICKMRLPNIKGCFENERCHLQKS